VIEQEDVERLSAAVERVVEEQVGELGDQLAQRLVADLVPHLRLQPSRPDASEPLVDVATVARYLSVSEQWVREHAASLRVRRFSSGSRTAMRFSLVEVDELLLRYGRGEAGG